jgi:tetratricopeptide (TPR) repeat protein
MKKTTGIDFSEDRLLAIASDYLEDHNYIGALKMLNKNAQINGNAEESYMLYAETFDDMELYEKCINGWFKYIDYADSACDMSDAYEGLAVSFLNLGQENFAAYYYNRLLMETAEDLTNEDREQIINAFLSSDKPSLKIAYPPKLADYTKEMDNGVSMMRLNNYDGAIAEFEKVHEDNEKHASARNYIAMCKIISDKADEAEQECTHILEKYPDNVQALTTMAAIKRQQGKVDESLSIAQKLLGLKVDSLDDIYKIATVCCENELHEDAYRLFCKLEGEFCYDTNVLYFKAVAAYNCGHAEASLQAFDTILTINPDAVTARYYRDYVKKNEKNKKYEKKPLKYFYRLPQKEREANLQFLTLYTSLGKKEADMLASEIDISECIKWCFDESDGRDNVELQMLGASCALKAGLEDMLRDILLDTTVADPVKMETIGEITQRNEGISYGVVVCNLYRKLYIPRLVIGRAKKNVFLLAYSLLVSRFAMLNADYVFLIHSAATTMYNDFSDNGKLSLCTDYSSLAAAIYHFSGIKEAGLNEGDICSFFGADEKKYNKLIKKD